MDEDVEVEMILGLSGSADQCACVAGGSLPFLFDADAYACGAYLVARLRCTLSRVK